MATILSNILSISIMSIILLFTFAFLGYITELMDSDPGLAIGIILGILVLVLIFI